MTLSTPGGMPASSASAPYLDAVSGVCSATWTPGMEHRLHEKDAGFPEQGLAYVVNFRPLQSSVHSCLHMCTSRLHTFTTMALPVASAGATFQVSMSAGKFHLRSIQVFAWCCHRCKYASLKV